MNDKAVKSVGILALLTSLLSAAPASAQEATATSSILEEIVVTAQKREQNLQDVGISITAFGREQLQELNLNNSNELVYLTPGLALGNPGGEGNITALSLRGIGQGDFADHQESPVAVYQDEVYDAYMGATNTTLFDQERVEILRGPQGTLFGRNATGGLVHYISRKPTDEFEGYGNISYAEYNHIRFEGAAGGPIADNLQVRVSGFVNNHDTYVDNIGTGKDGNEADTWAVRGQVLFSPSDNLDILFRLEYYDTEITQWYYETAPATSVYYYDYRNYQAFAYVALSQLWTSVDDRWSAAVFVKNIADKEYITYISNNSGFPPFIAHVQRFYARPRWVGGQISYRWN